MPMPKRKHCKWKRDQRRAHIKLAAPSLVPCEELGGKMVPKNLLKSYQQGLITERK